VARKLPMATGIVIFVSPDKNSTAYKHSFQE